MTNEEAYRKLLRDHGLKLVYDPKLKISCAKKTIDGSYIGVIRRERDFTIIVYLGGSRREYFEREAEVLKRELLKNPCVTSASIIYG